MWNVIEGLFISTDADASDLAVLEVHSITHVVNCATELPDNHPDHFKYLRLELKDPDSTLGQRIPESCDFIDEGRKTGNVLVHCNGAVSRSPSIVLAYLCHQGATLIEAAGLLAEIVQTRPNKVFLEQIA